MLSNVTGLVFETDCEIGKPSGVVEPCNVLSFCTEPGSPNLPASETVTIKSGILTSEDFTGTPLVATVTFENPFTDVSYAIAISGEDARIFTYQTKTVNGFVINTNANGSLSGEVSWTATPIGEV